MTDFRNMCHRCGREMDSYKPPEHESPGCGTCPEHGVSYDLTFIGPGSIFDEEGLDESHPDVTEEVIERVRG